MTRKNIFEFNKGSFKNIYTCPSKFRLLPQWFWDTGFQSIYEKWMHDMPVPEESLKNILNNQDEDGHLIFTIDIDGDVCRRLGEGKVIQPFILPISIWDIYLKTGNRSLLEFTLEKLVKFDRWMTENRRIQGSSLIHIILSGETGWDNSKRFLFNTEEFIIENTLKACKIYPVDLIHIYIFHRYLSPKWHRS